jgi:hypothetical protein
MRTVSLDEFKAILEKPIKDIVKDGEFIVMDSSKKLFIVSPAIKEKSGKRMLGTLDGKVDFKIRDDWEMSAEELLGLDKDTIKENLNERL